MVRDERQNLIKLPLNPDRQCVITPRTSRKLATLRKDVTVHRSKTKQTNALSL